MLNFSSASSALLPSSLPTVSTTKDGYTLTVGLEEQNEFINDKPPECEKTVMSFRRQIPTDITNFLPYDF